MFLVLDGDIGINMSLLMVSGVKYECEEISIKVGDLVLVLVKGFLMGVCGNFGVILL